MTVMYSKAFKKIITIFLAALMLFALCACDVKTDRNFISKILPHPVPAPAAGIGGGEDTPWSPEPPDYPEPDPKPTPPHSGYDDLFFDYITLPEDSAFLSEPEYKYLKTVNGNFAYLYTSYDTKSDCDRVEEGSYLTVYAYYYGRALIINPSSRQQGWVNADLLSYSYYSGPNPADTTNLIPGMERPVSSDYIDFYDTRYVKSSGGVAIYLRYGPSKTAYDYFDTVKERSRVTVLAIRDDYAFVRTEDGRRGWCHYGFLVESYY